MKRDSSKLTRDTHTMPGFVKQALDESGLTTTYEERPAYQQNDYTGRINRAKRQETKRKRLQKMLYELEVGGVYMGMNHPASAKKKNPPSSSL